MYFCVVLLWALVIGPAFTEAELTQAPTFTNCPAQKIVTHDVRYKLPTLTATDDKDTPTITKEQGPDGPVFPVGVHIFKYTAKDTSGQRATCVFMLEVKGADCAKPTHSDPDMKLTCSGHGHGSVCQLTCKSGTSVEGDKYIHCVSDNSTTENTSHWQPVTGKPGKCFKRKCKTLHAPARGAVICDTTTGGTLCQVMCDRTYDVRRGGGFATTYICSARNSEWKPWANVADCLQYKSSIMNLPDKDYYFDGDCSGALDQIRGQFMSNMNKLKIQTCNGKKCTNDQLQVTCGAKITDDDIWDRRKRNMDLMDEGAWDDTVDAGAGNSVEDPRFDMGDTGASNSVEDPWGDMGDTGAGDSIKDPWGAIGDMDYTMEEYFGEIISLEDLAYEYDTSFPWDSFEEDMTDCAEGLVLSGDQCKVCPSGFYKLRKACEPCPEGTYRDESGGKACDKCALGQNTSFVASTSNDCVPLCKKNYFSPTGRQPCFPCLKGSCQSKVGAQTCEPCEAGTTFAELLNPTYTGLDFAIMDDLVEEPELTNRLIANFLLDCQHRSCLYEDEGYVDEEGYGEEGGRFLSRL